MVKHGCINKLLLLVTQEILVGKSVYDSVTQNIPQTFVVMQTLQASTEIIEQQSVSVQELLADSCPTEI